MNKPSPESQWKHKNGNIYTVKSFTNEASENNEYPVTVVYEGENGNVWSRPLERWYSSMTLIEDKK